MPNSTIQQLQWSSLTAAINEIRSPNQFLKKFIFGMHESKPTETIELSVFNKGRETAPFVRKNGSAVMVQGHSETFYTVEAPNIRIKRPFTASELLFNRRPGSVIFAAAQDIIGAIERHVAIDLKVMADMITNSEEYLSSLVIQNAVSWAVSDRDVYKITVPVPAANNTAAAIFWDDVDPQAPTPELDFQAVKRIISKGVGLGLTDVILGQEASDAFIKLMARARYVARWNTQAANIDLQTMFSDDGVIYLGSFMGLRIWEYPRTVSVDGVDTSMIRPKYAEFFCITPAAENVLYYGAIPDLEAFEGRNFVGERFSTSWLERDPSVRINLAHSRPLPWIRRPGAHVSMKVVSG